MSEILLTFVHISDTHISQHPSYNTDFGEVTTLVGVKALVEQLNNLPFEPDFVLHTGDVAYNPDPEEIWNEDSWAFHFSLGMAF